jgi:glyoxylase-like metal-dependent hydrolase (beta-lactamase superfamily II)
MRLMTDHVADGVYRLGTRWVNFYVVVDGSEAILVDAGYPGYVEQITTLLDRISLPTSAVAAVVVTHHHVDHAGTAEAIRSSAGARIVVHRDDVEKVTGEQRSHVPPGFYRHSWRPSMFRYLAHTIAAGGARYRPIAEVQTLDGDQAMDLPGRARIVCTPGHTAGHFSVLLPERGVLFAGDALVNFDGLDAEVVLFGHGDPWPGTPRSAVESIDAGSA